MRDFLSACTRNWISLAGAVITTVSALIFLVLFGIEHLGFEGSSYTGMISFLLLPAGFVFGLILIPIGRWLEQRRAAKLGVQAPQGFPTIDLNHPRTRKTAFLVVVLTFVNVVIIALATYKGVEVMDSTGFCGTLCHSVMSPEYTAYQGSPHARVACVECHIGPGAGWFVKSKLSGAWQLVAVTLDLYPRPIPTPVHNLRPSRETCEQCHWPTKFVGERLKIINHYADDEANTESKTVMLLRTGGALGDKSHGIHWHVDPGNQITYRSDDKRLKIPEVVLTRADGSKKVYKAEGSEDPSATMWRTMDCVDCHNRPTHIYQVPTKAVDDAIARGAIDKSLPYVKREALRLLQAEYGSHEQAKAAISKGLQEFYAKEHAEAAAQKADAIKAAGEELGRLYSRNVFPQMKVLWNTYPNFIGHETAPGCFRCHDGEHVTEKGEKISQSCKQCHRLLADHEESPEILQQLAP